MNFERVRQQYPRASYAASASPSALTRLEQYSSRLSLALSPLYRFSDGFEMVIRGGEIYLQLFSIEEFESAGEFLVIGTDTYGSDLIVDLGKPLHPAFWHCSFSRPIQRDRGELVLESIDDLLPWMIGGTLEAAG